MSAHSDSSLKSQMEELTRRNTKLEHRLEEERKKNMLSEKMMISQSRMAMMGEMIGMIAHQWRQPITIIGMITNNTLIDIQLGEFNKEQLTQDLHLIDKQIHYLSRTIDDFRNFFRPNKFPQQVTLKALSEELTTILGKNFETLGIALTFEGDADMVLTTYKNELMQVFLNILTNAKDAFESHKEKKKEITFSARQRGSSALFFISDNAGGIAADVFAHIFDPYFTTKSDQEGTGLGLYMSSMIVEKHLHGTIRACTDHSGTTFAVTIPVQYSQEIRHVY